MFKLVIKFCLALLLMMMTGIVFMYFLVAILSMFTSDSKENDAYFNSLISRLGSHSVDSFAPPDDQTQSQNSLYQDIIFDDTMISRTLWPNDSQCSSYKVRFVKNMTTGWLLTFPRSGNSWARYMLEASSGIFTSSVYKNHLKVEAGYYGEKYDVKNRNTILSKTHDTASIGHAPANLPVVTIIRNPARSIVSFWNFKQIKDPAERDHGLADAAVFDSKGYHTFLRKELKKWNETYAYILDRTTKLHVVSYEKLREDPLKELRAMLRFLKVPVDEGRISCLSSYLEGDCKGGQRELNPNTQEEEDLINATVTRMNDLLQSRGFTPLPDYKQYVN